MKNPLKKESREQNTNKASSHTRIFGRIAHRTQKQNKPENLFEWAFVHEDKITSLAEDLAIREKWYFGEKEPAECRKKYGVLFKYLNHTFGKLSDENKILYSEEGEDEFAAFNTGLVDKKYEYIYALFEKNRIRNQNPDKPEWFLKGFFVAGIDWGGKLLVERFNPLPSRADYFKGSMNSVLYEPSSGEFRLDIDHILVENCRRLPAKFFEEICRPHNFTVIDGMSFSEAQKLDERDERSIDYFSRFQQKLKDSEENFRSVKRELEKAVDTAKKRAEWNYKTAIPMYYPTKKNMSFLLPLSLLKEGTVDVALVVEKMKNGNYQGQTILPLDWAYSNSRLITKPESDWLNTNSIFNTFDEEENCLHETESNLKETPSQTTKTKKKSARSTIKAQAFKPDPVILAHLMADRKHAYSKSEQKLTQPPIKAQVFKPDEAILARIKESQKPAAAKKESRLNKLSEEARAIEEAKSRARVVGLKVSLKRAKPLKKPNDDDDMPFGRPPVTF